MRPHWNHPRITIVAPLLAALAVVAIACGSTAAPDSTPPPGSEPAPQSPDAAGGPGYEVGQQAPDFVLTLDDGQRASLASLRTESRPVVLYFFTTW